MNALALAAFSLLITFSQASYTQVNETHVDFTLSPAVIKNGDVQLAFEWITPTEFRKRSLNLMDVPGMSELHPNNNQMIVSKMAFISKNPFDTLSQTQMNNSKYIADMLGSVRISPKADGVWTVTNQVKAYGVPFKVSFDLEFREVPGASLGGPLHDYLIDEASAFSAPGRERFLVLDMTRFSQLMYRNYSVVYLKELSSKETLVVSGVISAFNIAKANTYFNYPPFSTTRGTMMRNLRTQTLNMVRSIQE